MWPKALTQLIELAPHITRLAPLADRFIKDKAQGEETTRQAFESQRVALEAQRAAVSDLGTSVRADLGALASAQTTQTTHITSLGRQIADLEKQFGNSRGDALTVKQATDNMEVRIRAMEAAQARTHALLFGVLALSVLLLVLLVVVLLRVH